jgi:hypothetical protein
MWLKCHINANDSEGTDFIKRVPYFPAHKTHFFFPKKLPKFDLRLMRRG